MKRIAKQKMWIILLSVCGMLLFSVSSFAMKPGDPDGDGLVTASDARLVLRAAVGLETYKKGSDRFVACDVDSDGGITASDARIILRVAVGLETLAAELDPVQPSEPTKLESSEVYELARTFTYEISVVKTGSAVTGSGFSISNDGIIVTNYHVIENAKEITVKDDQENQYPVQSILAFSDMYDIAVLKIDAGTIAAELNKTDYRTGDKIYTLGSSVGLTGTFSDGMISTRERQGPCYADSSVLMTYIQISAPISHGNSGGPLLDEYGRVIGINTLIRSDAQNINLAVPVSYLDMLDYSNPMSVESYYNSQVPVQLFLQTNQLNLKKGALAPVRILTESQIDNYTISFICDSDKIDVKWGEWYGNEINLYVFADSYCFNETIRIYIKELPEIYSDIKVTVSSSSRQSEYYGFPGIPDFGVMTSVPPISFYENEKHANFSATYAVSWLAEAGYTDISSLRNRYFALLEQAGFTFSEINTDYYPDHVNWFYYNKVSGKLVMYVEDSTDGGNTVSSISIWWN